MNFSSPKAMLIEMKNINSELLVYVQDPIKTKHDDFEIISFPQLWGSTAGGHDIYFGGSAMTVQQTYVLCPKVSHEKYMIFFGGSYAYSVDGTDELLLDISKHEVAGLSLYAEKYLNSQK